MYDSWWNFSAWTFNAWKKRVHARAESMNVTLALFSMDMNIVTSIEFSHSLEAMRAHDE